MHVRTTKAALLAAALLDLGGCGGSPGPIDLLRATMRLEEATVAGRPKNWVIGQIGRQLRLHDVVRRTLPASPPSRLVYTVDVPRDAHFAFDCGIPPERHDRAGVEFAVKVRRRDREETLWTSLLNPVSRPAHRKWVPGDVDLSKYAGQNVDLILETHGFERDDEPRAAFWGSPAISAPSARAPVVIVYLVDTLRADHTGPYGYDRDTTPELTRFAKDAVVFETAVAQASWTKPSVASIMTSKLPGQHRAVQLRDPLDQSHFTLAEMMEAKGYSTGAAIANSVIYLEGSNFEQGFDSFVGLHGARDRPTKVVEAAPVVDAALRWLEARQGFPTLLYVHTMDPHVPYTPPPPFDLKFDPHPTKDHPGIDPRTDYKEPIDREVLMAQYDGEIAYGDQEFGRFIRSLKERGLYDRALIVFVGDHGEEFQDHDKWLHGRSVFDELVHIPLIVKFPDQRDAGRRVKQQVQEVDLLPTILEEQGLPVPAAPAIAGHPLQEVVKGGAPEPAAIMEISHRGYVAHGVRTSKDKYVQRFSPEEDELYFDLAKDPKERTNRIGEFAERARLLKAKVDEIMIPNPFRQVLKFTGAGEYVLKLRCGGWIEGVQAEGLGQGEKYETEASGRKLSLRIRPRPGQPREVGFGVRPMGAPVYLEGTRDGRPLAVTDVYLAQEAAHPGSVPFRLPELETTGDTDKEESVLHLFDPPAMDRPGLYFWLRKTREYDVIKIPSDECEKLKALGYVGSCPAASAPKP